ncbi:Hsp20/alpha crystallin family protein [Frankia sp. Cppng1_Ct_nod]|uniref:Hsp20/alpha crystallin family protein n=1 Tax=Frankia sp. Cppng1_Ct_nod TaxID=2897162 RepID=UPI0010411CA7|nr:Hsp20/alpha crystallin family protein [Frankia sp. Cppng1_Ct_nod]
MSTYLWDPFAAFGRLDREFDEIVRRSWGGRDRARTVRVGFAPPADVVTEGDDIVVHLELPGVDVEKDVAVELERGRLVVRGERTGTRQDDSHGIVLRERRHGVFHREFSLPDGVGADQISATYDHGVLSLRLAGAIAAGRGARIPVAPGAPAVLEGSGSSDAAAPAAGQAPAVEGNPAH